MPKRGERRRVQWEAFCRKGIQEAVVRLLASEGSGALTMARVAAEAGVAKGTLYVYFKDKRALLQSVKEDTVRPLREEIAALLEGPLPPSKKLEEMVRRQVAYFDEHREFLKVLLWQRQILESHARRQSSDPYRALVARVAAVIEQGIQEGSFKPMDARKAAAILVEATMATVTQRLWAEKPSPLDEDVRTLLEVVLHGLSAPQVPHSKRGCA
jgi:AcrR family transcriptional regulator